MRTETRRRDLAAGAMLHADHGCIAAQPPRRLRRDVDAPCLVQHRLAAAGRGGRSDAVPDKGGGQGRDGPLRSSRRTATARASWPAPRGRERCRRRCSRGNVGRFANVECFGQGVRVHVRHHLIPVARRPPVESARKGALGNHPQRIRLSLRQRRRFRLCARVSFPSAADAGASAPRAWSHAASAPAAPPRPPPATDGPEPPPSRSRPPTFVATASRAAAGPRPALPSGPPAATPASA